MIEEFENRGRRSIRLSHFDYSSEGAYFITICTENRRTIFGQVVDGFVALTRIGQVLSDEWFIVPGLRPEIVCDEFVIMPNHFHAIVFIQKVEQRPISTFSTRVGAHGNAPCVRQPRSIGSFVSGFKGSVTRAARWITSDPNFVVWQRNYYEHIIRNEADLAEKREYIRNNPLKWELDEYYAV